ncbi:MAG: TonB-dependent siderophore receptor [Opitutaceae bacterium]|nr:TonB-dependent siderophore receptor [Opitutaceae bacterium]
MNPIPPPRWLSFGALSALAFTAGLLSVARAQPAPAAAEELPPVTLETYVVTEKQAKGFKAERVQVGTFRDVDPVDVPVSVNVLTRELLDAQAARGLYDALRNTAGVTRSQVSGSAYDNISVRGIVVENRGNYRLNGSLPVINLVDLSMENKERVEVLKGATGLYYGFVPPSGIINMVTKRAGPKPVTAVTFNVNSHGAVGGHVDVGRRFGPEGRGGIRVNLAASSEDIGIDNFDGDRQFGAVALDWAFTERLLLRFDLEHIRKDTPEQGAIGLPAAVANVITLPPLPPNTRNYASSWQRYDAQATNVLLRADFLLSRQWTVLVEAGYAKTERDRLLGQILNYNLTTGAGTFRISYAPNLEYENNNGRAELFGRFLTGGVRHDVTFGVTSNKRYQNTRSAGQRNLTQNYFNPVPIPEQGPPSAVTDNISTIYDTGIYLFDRLSACQDRVQFIVGVRDTIYESETATSTYKESSDFRPMASAVYKPTPRSSVYVSYLEGPEQGGIAGLTLANAGELLPPLVSTQWEVGAKAEVLGGVLVQLGLFEIERPSTFIDGSNRLVPNGLARYRGAEIFLSGEITPQVSVVASALLLDAKQVNAQNATTLDRTPEGTPEKTASLFLEWRPPFQAGLTLSAGAFYTGYVPVNNANQGFLPGYTTYSAGASYTFRLGGCDYTARVTGDNLSDKNAWSTAGASLLGVTFPRTYKFSLTARF